MKLIQNPLRGRGLGCADQLVVGEVADDPAPVLALLAHCPAHSATPLTASDALAAVLGVNAIYFKDERTRMGLGSFKALGAAYAIAKLAAARVDDPASARGALAGETFVTASAGNHGLSVAAGARVFGANSVIYLAETVPPGFADRLRAFGAEVVVEGANYAASMAAASKAADDNGWSLLSDGTWEDYDVGRDVMEGYLAMAAEAADQIGEAPTHIFLQAGVGGLAAACAAYARRVWGDAPVITVVEPNRAATLLESVLADAPTHAPGPDSVMGRLDCKDPSHIALKGLARDADHFMALPDDYVVASLDQLASAGLGASASGGAGFAGALAAAGDGALGLGPESRVLIYISEGPQDD